MSADRELNGAKKSLVSVERLLLSAILGMQLVIAWGLFRPVPETAEAKRVGDDPVAAEVAIPESAPPQAVLSARVIARRNPLEEIYALFPGAIENMARLRSAMYIDEGWEKIGTSPTMDMRDGESGYLVSFSIPGARASDMAVLLDGRVLTVQALTPVRGPYSTHLRRFERRVLLPGPVGGAADAHASITNGILRVLIPKGSGGDPLHESKRLF